MTTGALLLNGSATQSYEVAGQDQGQTAMGLSSNFAIGELDVATGANVTFQDAGDNDGFGQLACSEALYVDTLIQGSGSTMTIDDVRVYYLHRIDQGGSVNLVGCGQLLGIPSGDYDGDGDVDEADYILFDDCLNGPNAAPTPSTATVQQCLDTFDFDLDGDVDLQDFADFGGVYTGSF